MVSHSEMIQIDSETIKQLKGFIGQIYCQAYVDALIRNGWKPKEAIRDCVAMYSEAGMEENDLINLFNRMCKDFDVL